MPTYPTRLWLPMLIIDRKKKFIGKVGLQKLVYLVQMEAKINLYVFKKHHYGPYSSDLNYDLTSNSELIAVESRSSTLNPGQIYYGFELTEEGKKTLEDFKVQLGNDFLRKILPLVDEYCALPTDKLIEKAYSTFRGVDDHIIPLEINVEKLHSDIEEIFDKNCNRQSLFILMIVDYLKEALGKAKGLRDEVQKAVIYNFSEEIIHQCEKVLPEIAPPVKSDILRPKFIDLADLWGTLIDYCDKIGLVKNPFTKDFEEILSEDEAIRLQQALQSIELD